MSDLGPVSTVLEAELRELARERGIVVWLDKEGSYGAFADALARKSAASPTALPVRTFRGSFLETMLALEDLEDGAVMTPLVVHVPGHTEESIAETPLFELYRAGSRHRRALPTLVRDAAHGIATPAALEEFLAEPGITLDGADAWLAAQAAGAPTGYGVELVKVSAEELYDDMVNLGQFANRMDRGDMEPAVWNRAEVLLGLTEVDRRRLLAEREEPHTSRPGYMERARDVAEALAAWVLCVEFVHDLRREPEDAWLRPLLLLPRPAVIACQRLANHLRRCHSERYASIALEVEALIPREVADATADDLGKIDTFQFEDAKVMAAALDALHGAQFRRAHELATARTSGKSFWTAFDLRRRVAWNLIERAAQLGIAVVAHGELLDDCPDLADAVARYAGGGFDVDRAHRQLEQAREELPLLDIPEATVLRARLDDLRRVYRGWADRLAHAFNALCRQGGFLPAPALQQRTLFEDVVVPAAGEGLTAYFMVDALRFEMGAQLAESLRETKTAIVDLGARLAELPTITEVGMNALAPVARNGTLTVDVKDGKILGFRVGALRVDGPDDRRRAIHDRLGGDACPRLSLEEVGERDAASLRKALARARAVIVHCEGIDKAGEKGVGLAVFERELQNLRAAWRVLYQAGVKRFVFAADHGFVLHDEVTRDALPHGKQTDPQRRHVLTDHRREQDGEVCVSARELGYDGADLHAAFPAGIAPFDRGARAKDFVHGGNSLQERVIPVITVRHRHAAGGEQATYEVAARAGLAVAGLHSLHVVVRPTRQATLAFGTQPEVELAFDSEDEGNVQVELCDVHHARRTGAGVLATVGQELQLFFRLLGDVETRAAVRVRGASRAVEVSPASTTERFQVMLRARPVTPVIEESPAAAPAGPAPARPGRTTAPPVAPSWLDGLPAGVRDVFRHLAEHGTINEDEAIGLLGGARQFRAFSRELETYCKQAPFVVHIEMASGGKCYKRGDPEGL